LKSFFRKIICFYFFVSVVNAQEIDNDIVFQGIIQQSHDYTCGSGALATLITGLIENSHVSEADIINSIVSPDAKENGYSAADLAKVSIKLGYHAEWRKIAKTELPKIKLPVLLLIGLNSEFPHYVVLKGVRNNQAYLADPIRGNIRIPYDELAKEGLNQKYPLWFVMAINPSKNKPKESVLYLSEAENERLAHHVTVEQSNAITLATLSKENQFIVDYDFTAALGNRKKDALATDSQNFSHAVNIRYGITDELQIGATFQHTDSYAQFSFEDTKLKQNSDDRAYGLNISNRFKLDAAGEYNLIAGLNGSYSEQNSIYSGGFNVTAYTNTSFAQFFVGGSINKQFARNSIKNSLPQFNYSVFVSANKPFADRYLGFINLSLSDAQAKNNDSEFNRSYSVSTGVSYVLSKHFQISPSFGYSFGQMDTFSFGMNIAYVGGW